MIDTMTEETNSFTTWLSLSMLRQTEGVIKPRGRGDQLPKLRVTSQTVYLTTVMGVATGERARGCSRPERQLLTFDD